MTCIKVKDKKALQEKLNQDGKKDLVGMFVKIGVMDNITSTPNLQMNITSKHSLSGIILADSPLDLKINKDEGQEYGENLQKILSLPSNPIAFVDGEIVMSNFNQIKQLVNNKVHAEYSKTQTSVNEAQDDMIVDPVVDRELERIEKTKIDLRDLYRSRDNLLAERLESNKPSITQLNKEIDILEDSLRKSNEYVENLNAFPNLVQVFKRMTDDKNLLNEMMRTPDTLTIKDIKFMRDTIDLWRSITSDTIDNNALNLDLEWENEKIANRLNQMAIFVNRIDARLDVLEENAAFKKSREVFSKDVTKEELLGYHKDDSGFTANFRGTRRSKNPLVQMIADLINKTSDLALAAYRKVEVAITNSYENVKPIIGTDFGIYIAEDENGKKMGSLVHMFTVDYWRKLRKANKSNFANKKRWLQNNTIVIDFNKLFIDNSESVPEQYRATPPTKEQSDKLRDALVRELGREGADEILNQAIKIVEDYSRKRDSMYELLSDANGLLSGTNLIKYRQWNDYHSPYKQSTNAITFKVKGTNNKYLKQNNSIIIRIPKKQIEGRDSGYYDNNYKTIMKNPALKTFYNVAKKIISNARADFNYTGGLHPNALPYLEKTAREQLMEGDKGVAKGWAKFKEHFHTAANLSEEKPGQAKVDARGNIVRTINKNITTIDEVANNLFEMKVLEFVDREGTDPTATQVQELYADAYEEVGEKQDLDLPKLLKLLAMNSIAYKHKSLVEDEVNTLTYLFNKGHKNPDTKKALANTGAMLNNMLEADFFGMTTKITRGNLYQAWGSKGRLNPKNKKAVALLEKEIDRVQNSRMPKDEKDIEVKKLEYRILGYYDAIYASQIVRNLIGYSRVLGIGYNAISSITNAVFGQIGNIQRGIQGDYFTVGELHKATMIVASQKKKVANLAEKTGLVGDVTYSLKSNSDSMKRTGAGGKIAKWGNPYTFQTVSEGFNQEPIMVAIMLNTKVENSNGDKSTLFDILDDEGEANTEYYDKNGLSGDELISNTMNTVRKVVQETHGDYNSTLMANNTEWLSAVLMFRRWLPEMYMRRFQSSGTDYVTGKDSTGIYIASIKALKDLVTGNKSEITDEQIGKVKATLLGDIGAMVILKIAGLLTEAMLCKDDPNCEDAPKAAMFVINIMKRVEDEISFFYNPFAWIEMLKNPASGTRLFEDFIRFFNALPAWWNWDSRDSFYQSGRNKGDNKGVVTTMKFVPLGNQMTRLWKYGNEPTYTKKYSTLWGDDDD